MSASILNESPTRYDSTENHQQVSHELDQRSLNTDSASHVNQQHSSKPSAMAKVFETRELLETILVQAHPRLLHIVLQQVCKNFQQTILGSINLQRNSHYLPDWKRTKMYPVPLPPSMVTWRARKDGRLFDYDTAPTIEPNTSHMISVCFNRDAVSSACSPYVTANSPLRTMLICQPPVVAVKIFCQSIIDSVPRFVGSRIDNANGVTCGQLFDLVERLSPIGRIAWLEWSFSDRTS